MKIVPALTADALPTPRLFASVLWQDELQKHGTSNETANLQPAANHWNTDCQCVIQMKEETWMHLNDAEWENVKARVK